MRLTYRLSEREFLEAQRLYRKSAGPIFASWRRNFQVGIVMIMAVAALLILVVRPDRKMFLNVLPLFILVAIFLVVLFILPKLQSRRMYARNPNLQEERVVEIYEDQLVFATPTSRAELKWEAFTGYLESENLFLIFQSRNLFNVLPKRAFGSAEAEQFSNLVARKLPKKS